MSDKEALDYEVKWQDGDESVKAKSFPSLKTAQTQAIKMSLKHGIASVIEWHINGDEDVNNDLAIQKWRYNTGTELDHKMLSREGEYLTRPSKNKVDAPVPVSTPTKNKSTAEALKPKETAATTQGKTTTTKTKETEPMATRKSSSKKAPAKKASKATKKAPVKKAAVKSVSVAFSGKKPTHSAEKIMEAFAAREGSIRHKFLKAVTASPGTGVKMEKVLKACYDSANNKNESALNMVIAGARKTIQKDNLPYVIHRSAAEGTVGIYGK